MDWIRFKLECIELILDTQKYTKCDLLYWEEERRLILKEILELQLKIW